jgi:hypothetical protein
MTGEREELNRQGLYQPFPADPKTFRNCRTRNRLLSTKPQDFSKRMAMKAEIISAVEEIQKSLSLLRRHL